MKCIWGGQLNTRIQNHYARCLWHNQRLHYTLFILTSDQTRLTFVLFKARTDFNSDNEKVGIKITSKDQELSLIYSRNVFPYFFIPFFCELYVHVCIYNLVYRDVSFLIKNPLFLKFYIHSLLGCFSVKWRWIEQTTPREGRHYCFNQ
jgi:hypothetical protein